MAEEKVTPSSAQSVESPASHSILFLPSLQLPVTRNQVREAYRDAINQAIQKVKPQALLVSRLDIAILFNGGHDISRTKFFSTFQTLVAEVYTLACISAGSLKVDLDFPGGVDLRIYALDAPYTDELIQGSTRAKESFTTTSGPLATLNAFQDSRISFNHSFAPGQTPLRSWFDARDWVPSSNTGPDIPNGVEYLSGPPLNKEIYSSRDTFTPAAVTSDPVRGKKHTRVIVGGTFDHLHVGHKLLLTALVYLAQPGDEDREITLGITGDELLVKKKHAEVLESWDVRQQRTADFVESILILHPDVSSIRSVEEFDEPGPNGKVVKVTYTPEESGGKVTVKYVRISDPFGPTITDESITALVLSAETRAGGKAVNDKRTEKGWAALELFEVDVLDPGSIDDMKGQGQYTESAVTSFETKISSTEIRRRLAVGEGQ